MMATVVAEAKLANQQGGSDKIYEAQLVHEPGGWSVRYAYGRRGTKLKEGVKIEGAGEAEARRVFEALLKEKKSGGYEPIGAPLASPAETVTPGAAPRPEAVMPPAMSAERIALRLPEAATQGSAEYERAVLRETRRQLGLLEASRSWHAEIKLDGHRCRVVVHEGKLVGIFPRKSLESSAQRFPELHQPLVDALPKRGTWVVDGELGYLDPTGLKMDFSVLQGRGRTKLRAIALEAKAFPMTFVAFDLLHAEGEEVWRRAHEDRQRRLREALTPNERVLLVESTGELLALYDRVVANGGEGVMLKRIGHPYQPGARSKDWMKVKAPNRLDSLHVVGLLQGTGVRARDFGAFVMARMDEAGRLHDVCKAGSGLSDEERARVMDATPRLRLTTMPLVKDPGRSVTSRLLMWLDRGIMADISYAEPVGEAPRQPTVQSISFLEDA